MSLSNEQEYAFNKFKQGHNFVITGPGGTGKTKLIEHMVEYCKFAGKRVQVCAMTGCATILLPKSCNARTIHSWSGIKIPKGANSQIVTNVCNNKKSCSTWRNTDILILDEVSMLSVRLLELLNEIAQTIRKSKLPFGGMQLVFCGDFFQLPPIFISNRDNKDEQEIDDNAEESNTDKSLSEELEKLNALRESGVLTQEEFEKAKNKLLNN